jgi:hypothetical protein
MLRMLDLGPRKADPNKRQVRECGVTILPSLGEQMASKHVAPSNGYYTKGKAQFKIRKGSRLPEKGKFDEIFFPDEVEVHETLTEKQAARIAENTADTEPTEVVAEDDPVEVSTTAKPQRVTAKAK